MALPLPEELVNAYQHAHFEVHLPGGRVILSRAGVQSRDSTLLPAESLTVVTAYNPGPLRPTAEENARAQRQLEGYVCRRGWTVYPALGANPERTHQEPSLAVLGLTPAQAARLGRRFHQAAVFYWHQGMGQLLWCNEPSPARRSSRSRGAGESR